MKVNHFILVDSNGSKREVRTNDRKFINLYQKPYSSIIFPDGFDGTNITNTYLRYIDSIVVGNGCKFGKKVTFHGASTLDVGESCVFQKLDIDSIACTLPSSCTVDKLTLSGNKVVTIESTSNIRDIRLYWIWKGFDLNLPPNSVLRKYFFDNPIGDASTAWAASFNPFPKGLTCKYLVLNISTGRVPIETLFPTDISVDRLVIHTYSSEWKTVYKILPGLQAVTEDMLKRDTIALKKGVKEAPAQLEAKNPKMYAFLKFLEDRDGASMKPALIQSNKQLAKLFKNIKGEHYDGFIKQPLPEYPGIKAIEYKSSFPS